MKKQSVVWWLPALMLGAGTGSALDEVPYRVAEKPWPDGLGNHRAVVRVEQKADAVVARIPWRRRDRDPERKDVIVVDVATSQRLTNVARLSHDRFEGALAFEPQTVPGDYFVYYLPYPAQKGWGNYNGNYFPPKDTAGAAWKARLPADTTTLPKARVLRLEARTEFDSLYPMEVVATPEEVRAMLERNAATNKVGQASRLPRTGETPVLPYLLFPEDRRFPIRMNDELPLRWVKSGPTNVFHGEAQRNEFYVFQIGVWAARTNLAGLDVEFDGEMGKWLNCFNTGGTNWDGQPFHKSLNVPQGRVQALWIGVDVPRDAKPGEHRATVIVRPTNAPPANVELVLTVLPIELADRGDGDLWRLSRLRWLNSALGSDRGVMFRKGMTPTTSVSDDQPEFDGRLVHLRSNVESANVRQIAYWKYDLLASPIRFELEGFRLRTICPYGADGGKDVGEVKLADDDIPPRLRRLEPVSWSSEATAEADGHIRCSFSLQAERDFSVTNLALHIPFRMVSTFPLDRDHEPLPTYFMGLGLRAQPTPTNFTWRWTGPYNSFWIGNAIAGVHLKLLGSSYEGPMQNLYHPKPPPNWFNEGKGSLTLTHTTNGVTRIQVFTGPFELKAGQERKFDFSLLVTPVKPLDTATHFRERYWHATGNIQDDVNVINVHHATVPNPFINYPFLAVDKLREFCHTQQARGRKVKIYYTVRELTSRLPELWALRSLGDEVLTGGPGGGYPWLREHLGSDYTTAWYTEVEGGEVDAAILTSGASRWYNFYVEGLNWLVRNVPIDGLYLDDVAYDRTILKRMRQVMDRARPGCLIDLHSNNLFSKGPAVQYTEFFPYVDRLWFGEGFDYDAMTPEQWLVECSGIPFGLMGDMLQDGGNRWRGMVFGMTVRAPWSGTQPRDLWRVWDDFGIADAKMSGWWEKNCPVRTDREDVLATAYVQSAVPTGEPPDYFRAGKTLVALASWAKEEVDVRLQFDWHALDVDPAKAKLVAPEVKDFQPARAWRVDEPISVEPKKGWLIYVTE